MCSARTARKRSRLSKLVSFSLLHLHVRLGVDDDSVDGGVLLLDAGDGTVLLESVALAGDGTLAVETDTVVYMLVSCMLMMWGREKNLRRSELVVDALAVAAGLLRVGDKGEAVKALTALEDLATGNVFDWAGCAEHVGGVVAGEEEGNVGDLTAEGGDGVVADVDVLVGAWVGKRSAGAVGWVRALGSRSELRSGRRDGSTEKGGNSEELHVDGSGGGGDGDSISGSDVKR